MLLEPDKLYSKYGKLQLRKKKQRASPILDLLPPPDITLFHDQTLLTLSPTAVRFWDKLRLGPRGGVKNILQVTICPDHPDVIKAVYHWKRELYATWEMCGFGSMDDVHFSSKFGIFAVPLTGEYRFEYNQLP
jgi:hypothetical protein